MAVKTLKAKVTHTTPINERNIYSYSPTLNVTLASPSALENGDLNSDKLTVLSGVSGPTKFYFVTGDKLLIIKSVTTYDGTNYNINNTRTGVINVNQTGWLTLSDLAPVGFKETEITGTNVFNCLYYIEPVEYTGDRYYGGAIGGLLRISSIPFCKRFIFAASELAPVGIKDNSSIMRYWGGGSNVTLVIPAWMEDLSGLFDGATNIGSLLGSIALPKIITLGKPKTMSRTFYNAFAYGTDNYSPLASAVVFGEMDVSEVTDFSYCFGQCFQANPDVQNWNVANATNMTGMFQIVTDSTTDVWTRDLSKWCVSKIPSQPTNFSLNHPMTAAQKPVWGTCPVRKVTTVTLTPGLVQEGPYTADNNYTFKSSGYNTDPMYNIVGTLLPNKIVTAAGATVTFKYIDVIDLTKTSTGQVYTTSEIVTDGNLGNNFEVVLNGVTYVYQLMKVLPEYGYWYSINPNGYIDPSQLSLPCPDFRQATTFDIRIFV